MKVREAMPVATTGMVGNARATLARLSLAVRFALFCLVILVAGAFIIGAWVSREIETGVIDRTSAVTALYVESSVKPHLTGLETGRSLTEVDMANLAALVADTSLGRQIALFKVWSPDGTVLYSNDSRLIGRRFPLEDDLDAAFAGKVESSMSTLDKDENTLDREQFSQLIETYTPVRSETGEVIAAVELYQLPHDLLAQVRDSQRRGWLIVGGATVTMYLLLVGLVAGASRTITRQNRGLQEAFRQEKSLQARIRSLNLRLQRAAAQKTQTDEELLRRLSQDLHDGPAQDLALALLRIESVRRPDTPEEDQAILATVRFALSHSLEEIRQITTDLRLPQLDGLDWQGIVDKAASEHQRRTGDIVHIDAGGVAPGPTAPQRIAAYRVVQEALSNASRHSGARDQWVRLASDDGTCVIAVEDRGRGFEAGRHQPFEGRRARLGLQGMRERIELLGGSLSITSEQGRGTTVVARLPLESGGEP